MAGFNSVLHGALSSRGPLPRRPSGRASRPTAFYDITESRVCNRNRGEIARGQPSFTNWSPAGSLRAWPQPWPRGQRQSQLTWAPSLARPAGGAGGRGAIGGGGAGGLATGVAAGNVTVNATFGGFSVDSGG